MLPTAEMNTSRKALWFASMCFIILLIFPIAAGLFFYNNGNVLAARSLQDQRTLVGITATAVHMKLGRLVGIVSSMAVTKGVVANASAGNWDAVAAVLRDVQNNVDFYDPYIDRVVAFNRAAVEMSAYPELAGGIGGSFADSDWYRALSGGSAPFYVSQVTKRVSLPKINVVNIAAPILSGHAIVGFVVAQVPTGRFLEFGNDVSLGTFGITFIVDQKGNIVAHPKIDAGNSAIANFANISFVGKVMDGQAGLEINYSPSDNENIVNTYAPISGYGWGVIVQEPSNEVFVAADRMFFAMKLIVLILLIMDLVVSYAIFHLLRRRYKTEMK